MDTKAKRKELLSLTVRHDSMEFTTNEQFSLSDELVLFARAALAEVERLKEGIGRHTEDMDGLARDVGIWGKQQHADELIEMYDGLRALLNPETPEVDHE